MFRITWITTLCLLMLNVPGYAANDDKSDEFHPLFDGETLEGWEGNVEFFRVEQDCIVAGTMEHPIPRNEFLSTKQRYQDFELLLEVKVKGDGVNAGIQIRSERIPDHHEMIGYQADVGQQWWGKLYDESRRRRVLAGPPESVDMSKVVKSDDWNLYRIRCQGNHIQLWLNGTQTVDYTEPDAAIARDGHIALQIHSGPPSEAWYRNIRIRELK